MGWREYAERLLLGDTWAPGNGDYGREAERRHMAGPDRNRNVSFGVRNGKKQTFGAPASWSSFVVKSALTLHVIDENTPRPDAERRG